MNGVNGWFWANQRTPAGMEAVGTNALLTKGNTSMVRDRLFAPAGVLATSPKATAIQVRARVSTANMPAAATHSTGVAVGRNPSARATATTSAPLIMVRMRLPRTWPVSTEARVMAMVRNRAMMPSLGVAEHTDEHQQEEDGHRHAADGHGRVTQGVPDVAAQHR